MKKIILIAITALITSGAFAQISKEVKSEVSDTCCWKISPVKGQCPHSTVAVMKDNSTLICLLCYDKSDQRSKCGTNMEIKKRKGMKKG